MLVARQTFTAQDDAKKNMLTFMQAFSFCTPSSEFALREHTRRALRVQAQKQIQNTLGIAQKASLM